MEDDAPKPIGTPPKVVSLTGKILPWKREGGPVMLGMPGTDNRYIPCFSDLTHMTEFLSEAKIEFASIKNIDDEMEFLASIPVEIKVILDPYFLPNKRVRFQEIDRPTGS